MYGDRVAAWPQPRGVTSPAPRVAAAAMATRAPLCLMPFPRLGSSSSNWFFLQTPREKRWFPQKPEPKTQLSAKKICPARAQGKGEIRSAAAAAAPLWEAPPFTWKPPFCRRGRFPRGRRVAPPAGKSRRTRLENRRLAGLKIPQRAIGRRPSAFQSPQGARSFALPSSLASALLSKKRRFCLRPAPRGRAPPAGSRLPHAFAAFGARGRSASFSKTPFGRRQRKPDKPDAFT